MSLKFDNAIASVAKDSYATNFEEFTWNDWTVIRGWRFYYRREWVKIGKVTNLEFNICK